MHGDTASLKRTEFNGTTELLHACTYTDDVSLRMITKPYEPYIIPYKQWCTDCGSHICYVLHKYLSKKCHN